MPLNLSRRFACLFVICMTLGLVQGCSAKEEKVKHSAEELKKFLNIPTPVAETTFELATLPETQEGVPGPTDYVVLVAAVKLADGAQDKLLSQLASYTGRRDVQPAFVRPWLRADQQDALKPKGGGMAAYDASSLVLRKAKRSFAIPVGDTLVIYVEYVAPN